MLSSRRPARVSTHALTSKGTAIKALEGFERTLHVLPAIFPFPKGPGHDRPVPGLPLKAPGAFLGIPEGQQDLGQSKRAWVQQRPGPGLNEAANLVEALFEQGLQQGAMSGLSLRLLPPTVLRAAPRLAVAAETAPAMASAWAPPLQPAVPPSASLSRSEITQIADRVGQVLFERQRFERERQGTI